MTHTEFYKLVTPLPLFQGIGGSDLVRIRERAQIRFLSLDEEDDLLLNAGQRCIMMTWLVEGELIRRTVDPHGKWILEETVQAPAVLEPEAMFSLSQQITSSWINPRGNGKLMCVYKEHVKKVLMMNEIIRTNMLCYLSAHTQRLQEERMWVTMPDVKSKIIAFKNSICHNGSTRASIKVKMVDLAQIVGETRLNVSIALNKLEEEGIIRLYRNKIEFI